MPEIILNRTLWPVGHGAFYTEQFLDFNRKRVFTAVYDCGGKDENIIHQNIDNMVRVAGNVIDVLFISHLHRDHINGLDYLKSHTSVRRTILPYLTKPAIAEAYIYNAIIGAQNGHLDTDSQWQQFIFGLINDDAVDDNITFVLPGEGARMPEDPQEIPDIENVGARIRSGQVMKASGDVDGHRLYWIYIPVNVEYDDEKSQKLLNKINQIPHFANIKDADDFDWIELQNALRSANKKEIEAVKKVYKNIFVGKHNAYSMPVYSGPLYNSHPHYWDVYNYRDTYIQQWMRNGCVKSLYFRNDKKDRDFDFSQMLPCLYMGDFEAADEVKLLELQRMLGRYYDYVGMQQIPHHFSINNHSVELYKNRVCAFGNVDNHGDISYTQSVCREIEQYSPVLIITEEKKTKFRCFFDLW